MISVYHGSELSMTANKDVKIRVCLRCDQPFESAGLRICPTCTKKNLRVPARVDRGGSRRRGFSSSAT